MPTTLCHRKLIWWLVLLVVGSSSKHGSSTFVQSFGIDGQSSPEHQSRREILMGTAGTAASILVTDTIDPNPANAAANVAVNAADFSVDMDQLNAARRSGSYGRGSTLGYRGVVPVTDPPPMLRLRSDSGSGSGSGSGSDRLQIPRVGYSFYKTPTDQTARCTAIALRSGVRYLDMATDYGGGGGGGSGSGSGGSNSDIAKALKVYLDVGLSGLDRPYFSGDLETPEVLDRLDATRIAGDAHAKIMVFGGRSSSSSGSSLSPPPLGSAGRRGRREGLFLSHKLSNIEQSTDATSVRRSVKQAIATLGCQYLDMVSIHSPLTDRNRRLTTYQALLDLKESGFVKSVGVCNYGLQPLQELVQADLELPVLNQLEISPFHAHSDVVQWCNTNGVAVGCAAWSKLSGADGPQEGWTVVGQIAQAKKLTKAQVLVRWSLQKGYTCVPRSSVASKLERLAIAENSYGGVCTDKLTADEMQQLDALDISYKAGKLGRRDGWTDADVTGPNWDPTDFPG